MVLAGVADAGVRPAVDTVRLGWSAELGARTACPSHQTRLTGDPAFTRGELWSPVPADLAATVAGLDLAELDLPVLIVHGGADTVAPVRAAEAIAARLRRAELVTVHEGRHDILNDAPHRTVAAHLVQWLERVRNGPDAVPILDVRQPIHDRLASPA